MSVVRVMALLLFLAAARPLPAADRLLVLTEPIARTALGRVFDDWLFQIRRRETNFPGGVIVRELPRWTGGWLTNDWPGLDQMSNVVASLDPSAVVIVGHLPMLVTGSWDPDGHGFRCFESDAWLGCSNVVFTDRVAWPMSGFDAGTYPLNRNGIGDGRPDQDSGRFARWVGRIDAAGMEPTTSSGAWSDGCLAGQRRSPPVEEGLALRQYFTNNLAYRRGEWRTSPTAVVTGPIWNQPPQVNLGYLAGLNTNVAWTHSERAIGGGTPRFQYDNWALDEIENLYDADCVPTRGLVCVVYRSFCMEVHLPANVPNRRMFPGRLDRPYFLVSLWSGGGGALPTWWVSRSTDRLTGDLITSSVRKYPYFDGVTWYWAYKFLGDPTLPLEAPIGPAPRLPIDTFIIGRTP